MTEPTRLPIKSEKAPSTPAVRDWTAFDRLRADVDRLFDQLSSVSPWRWPGHLTIPSLVSAMSADGKTLLPSVDLVEHAGDYQLVAELPGLDEKTVEVKLVNGSLVIKGEKTTQRDEVEGDYHVSERRFGSYERAFTLPEGVDPAKIVATVAKGILTVTLPKTDEARKETKIPVRAA